MSDLRELLGIKRQTVRLWAPFRLFGLEIDRRNYEPSHGPQDWTDRPPFFVGIYRCISLLRLDRESAQHFSFNIWFYTARGARVWNVAFRKGARRFGVEPRYANDGVGGLEVDEYWDALQAAISQPTDPKQDSGTGAK